LKCNNFRVVSSERSRFSVVGGPAHLLCPSVGGGGELGVKGALTEGILLPEDVVGDLLSDPASSCCVVAVDYASGKLREDRVVSGVGEVVTGDRFAARLFP